MGRSKRKPYNEQFVTGAEAANLLDVTDRTIRTWAADPKRAIARNNDQKYGLISLLLACLEDARGKQKDLNTARAELAQVQTEKTRYEADIKRLERDRLQESLLDAEEVQKEWSNQLQKIKGKLLTLPRKLPLDLAGEMSPKLAQAMDSEERDTLLALWQDLLLKEVHSLLTELIEDDTDGGCEEDS